MGKKIREIVSSSVFLAIIEKILEMTINFVFSMVVVRLLDIKDYAVITTFTGYMTFVSFINIPPETFLYKSYSSYNKKERDEKITSFLFFDNIKAFIILCTYLIIGYMLSQKFNNIYYFFIALTNGLIIVAEQFYCIGRIILELNSKQYKLTKLTLMARVLRLALIFSLLIKNSFIIYCSVMIFVAYAEDFIGFTIAIKEIKYSYKFNFKNIISNIKFTLKDFVFLSHIAGVLNSIIYSSDTVFLGMFCDETIVGQYGIVLSCINYIAVLFQVVQKQVSIALGKDSNIKNNQKSVNFFGKLCFISSALILLMYVLFGKQLLKIYSGNSFADVMYWYGLFVLIGTCVFNVIRPLIIYLMYRDKMSIYLMHILIPVFIFTIVIYYMSSKYYGGIGIAFCNILAYLFWSILVIVRYFRITRRNNGR